jgi:cation transport ATPase
MLELAKAISLSVCILSLYWATISAFFVPGSQWRERLWMAFFKLLAAAAICFYSGMVFSWPSKTNPTAFQRLTSTLPVRLFFWAFACIVLLFALSWYLSEGQTEGLIAFH